MATFSIFLFWSVKGSWAVVSAKSWKRDPWMGMSASCGGRRAVGPAHGTGVPALPGGTGSPEVARGQAGDDGELLELGGDHVDHVVGAALEAAADEQGRRGAGDDAVALPAAAGDHDVDQAGLVLEVDERDPRRGRRALAVGDHTADQHPGAVGHRAQLLRGDRAAAVEVGAQEADRVAVG